jgi:hypothetical protein
MANNTLVKYHDEERLKFACAIINKLARIGTLVAGDLTPLTDLASFIVMLRAKQLAVATLGEQEILIDALLREVTWLAGIGLLTTAIITGLTSVRGTSAVTDLRFNFSQGVVSDPNFNPALEEYTAFASGSTAYLA